MHLPVYEFHLSAPAIGSGSNNEFVQLTEIGMQLDEVDPWHMQRRESKYLRRQEFETGFIMYDLHIHPPDNYHRKVWKAFTKALRNMLMRGPRASLKSSGAGLFCRPQGIWSFDGLPDFNGADGILDLQKAKWTHVLCVIMLEQQV